MSKTKPLSAILAWQLPFAMALCAVSSSALAFPNNNNFFGSNNNDCGNDWPVFTPMYWMEEMLGNNKDCYPNQAYRNYPANYPANYPQSLLPQSLSPQTISPTGTYDPYTQALLADAYRKGKLAQAATQAASQASPQTSQQDLQRLYLMRALAANNQNNRVRTASASPWESLISERSGLDPLSSALARQQNPLLGGLSPLSSISGANPFAALSGNGLSSSLGANPLNMGAFPGVNSLSGLGGASGLNPLGLSGMSRINPLGMGGMPGVSPLGLSGMTGMSPLSGMSGIPGVNPLSMGAMSGMGGIPGMNPLSGMSGMGMSPMGGGLSPFGTSPLGGSAFMPRF